MKHLTTRLVILLMLALMTIIGAYDYARLVRERRRLVELTQEDVRVFAGTLALAVRRNVRRGRTTEELRELLDEIRARPGLVHVAIYDPQGQLVADSVAEGVDGPVVDDFIRRALRSNDATSTLVEGAGGKALRYLQPFRWSDGRGAVLEVRQSLAGVEREFLRTLQERIRSGIVVLLFFVVSIVALTRWSVARPIRALIRGARAVGRGDLEQRIDVGRSDELGQLAEEFNRMAESLSGARRALLQESEERFRLERELHQAQKLAAVGTLAAEVAHEVGTPLNVISGHAEALRRVIPADDASRRHLDVILGQTDRITGIIRALLDYTRPRRPALREVEVVPLLARVTNLLRGHDRAKGARVRLDLPPLLPAVLADPDQLQQLFLNVMQNALDASPPGGAVRVSVGGEAVLPAEGRARILQGKAEAPCLAVHVVDEGPGLTPEQLDHVFEPFFSTKKRGQGTGLGLSIVEEIARAHRGEVEMLSVPGRGTEVIVRLPLAAGRPAERAGPAGRPESDADAG